MADRVIKIRFGAQELRNRLVGLVAALGGNARNELIDGAKLRVAVAFFSKIKEAFVVKARGGTDEAGLSWPRLKAETLAYTRRGVIRKATKQQVKAGRLKFDSLRAYNVAYRRELARLSMSLPREEARRRAKNIAVYESQQRTGGQTKIATARTLNPGVDYEILRDTGVLLNSINPGTIAGDSYTPKPGQIATLSHGELLVGTNVAYAATHHYGRADKGIPARPLWPEANQVPQSWRNDFNDAMQRGVAKAIEISARAA